MGRGGRNRGNTPAPAEKQGDGILQEDLLEEQIVDSDEPEQAPVPVTLTEDGHQNEHESEHASEHQ